MKLDEYYLLFITEKLLKRYNIPMGPKGFLDSISHMDMTNNYAIDTVVNYIDRVLDTYEVSNTIRNTANTATLHGRLKDRCGLLNETELQNDVENILQHVINGTALLRLLIYSGVYHTLINNPDLRAYAQLNLGAEELIEVFIALRNVNRNNVRAPRVLNIVDDTIDIMYDLGFKIN